MTPEDMHWLGGLMSWHADVALKYAPDSKGRGFHGAAAVRLADAIDELQQHSSTESNQEKT